MPCLSGSFQPGIGPLIDLGIAKSGTFIPNQPLKYNSFPALIDTGASATCISPSVAQTVGLQPIGKRPMVSATQAVPVNIYLVDLILTFGAAVFVVSGAQVMEFVPLGGSPFQILVGRDLICRGTLTMSFDGHFTFSI